MNNKVLKVVKKLILPVFFLAFAAMLVYIITGEPDDPSIVKTWLEEPVILAAPEELEKGFVEIQANEQYKLFFNETTTEIAVEDINNGKTWYSNPQNIADDPVANEVNKSELGSQVIIRYFNPTNKLAVMNSNTDAVSNNQYKFDYTEDGVKVTYSMGIQPKIWIIPAAVEQSCFETEFLDQIENEKDRKYVDGKFSLLDIDKMTDDIKDDMLEVFPILETQKIYVLRDVNDRIKEKVEAILIESNYTLDMKFADDAANQLDAANESKPVFQLAIDYTLDADGLNVKVPKADLKYPAGYIYSQIDVLPYFGAQDTSAEGYMFVPDGSGALIHLNNNKNHLSPYSGSVYGSDLAISPRESYNNTMQIHIPVFGVKDATGAFVGIIEEGDGFATVQADISGRKNAYNYVYSSYNIIEIEQVSLTGRDDTSINMFQRYHSPSDICIVYRFVDQANADYSGMAGAVRDYYVAEKGLTKTEETEKGLMVEMIGAIVDKRPFLGISREEVIPITTFEQAGEIVDLIKTADINNLSIKYIGWMDNGLVTTPANDMDIESKLGGKKDFEALQAQLSQDNIPLYPNVDFQTVLKDEAFDGFYRMSDSSKTITRRNSMAYTYMSNIFLPETGFYVVSPKMYDEYVDGFVKDYVKLDNPYLSVHRLTGDLVSDYNSDDIWDSEKGKAEVVTQLEKLTTAGYTLLGEGANQYALGYVNQMTGLPTHSSGYHIADESVPFLQMVYSGYVDYFTSPVNYQDGSLEEIKLKLIETGSSVYYLLGYESNSLINNTVLFDHLYTFQYDLWMSDLQETYLSVNEALEGTIGHSIESHETIQDGLVKVVYENGITIYVNYTDNDIEIDGLTVTAKNYVRGGE